MDFRTAFDPVRALGSAWRLMMRAPLTLIVGGIVIGLTEGGGCHSAGVQFDESGQFHPFAAMLAGSIVLVACCFGLALWVVNSLLHVGFARAVLRVASTGEERFGDLIEGRELWVSMLVARFLKGLIDVFALLPIGVIGAGPIVLGHALDIEGVGIVVGVVLTLLYLPIWIYVVLGLALVEQAVAIEGKDPVQALQRSWQIARGNRIQLLIYVVVGAVVSFAGVCACFVGVLVTSAWVLVARTESFARFALAVPEGGWWADRPAADTAR